jgi:cobalamin biosynthesis protein CobT
VSRAFTQALPKSSATREASSDDLAAQAAADAAQTAQAAADALEGAAGTEADGYHTASPSPP